MSSHFAHLGEEALAGLVISGVATLVFLVRYLYQLYVDSDKCTKHMKLCRASKKLLSCAFIGSLAIFISYLAMCFEQGFYLRSDSILVFWARFVAYAIASHSLFQIVGHLTWADKSGVDTASKLAALFWVVAGVFGTLSPANHNWGYFGAAFAPLIGGLSVLYLTSHREDKVAKGKLLWVSLGLAAFAVVWVISPAGADEIDLEQAQLGYLILEPLVFFLCYWMGIFYYIPMHKAKMVVKGKGRLRVPMRHASQCHECNPHYCTSSGESSCSDSDSDHHWF